MKWSGALPSQHRFIDSVLGKDIVHQNGRDSKPTVRINSCSTRTLARFLIQVLCSRL